MRSHSGCIAFRVPAGIRAVLCFCAPFSVSSDFLLAAAAVIDLAPALEKLAKNGVNDLVFCPPLGLGYPVNVFGPDRFLFGVVTVQKKVVEAMLQRRQVLCIAGVVTKVSHVELHLAFATVPTEQTQSLRIVILPVLVLAIAGGQFNGVWHDRRS